MSTNERNKDAPLAGRNRKWKAPNLYTTQTYWNQLEQDLLAAKHSVVVISPYLTMTRSDQYLNAFYTLKEKGRSILVITLPTECQRFHMRGQSRSVIGLLLAIDVRLLLVSRIHQKIVLIDDRICWEGSMNWLSHTTETAEHIRRVTAFKLVAEVRQSLSCYLDHFSDQFLRVAECVDTEQTYFGNPEISGTTKESHWDQQAIADAFE